ncbi:MAG: bifunctional phosphopantothenoylcysteine decarboxylase/phosphopantothenate--cysteine ligase CoaBC [Actinomycetes bacterium]
MRILVGITGGIAAYKSASVIRGFTEAGHNVKVLPTQNALRFIGATTLEALSHNVVDSDLYTDVESVKHIALAQEADLVVVAPATASFIARYAAGIADDLLLNVLLATKAKVVIAPAMHTEMWLHESTKENVAKLRARGVLVIEPDSGRLTGEDTGLGRLPEPEEIVRKSLAFYDSGVDLVAKKFLVVTGGTREPIDAVRFIGNSSSGKQGVALADAASDRGATVTVIAINVGMDLSRFKNLYTAKSFSDVQDLLQQHSADADVILMPAAISDYRVENPSQDKIHRSQEPSLELHLVANTDLLTNLVSAKASGALTQLIVGFAAEVVADQAELTTNAKNKLDSKGVDVIVANNVSNGQSFDSDDNSVLVVSNKGNDEAFTGSKYEVSNRILDYIKPLL